MARLSQTRGELRILLVPVMLEPTLRSECSWHERKEPTWRPSPELHALSVAADKASDALDVVTELQKRRVANQHAELECFQSVGSEC